MGISVSRILAVRSSVGWEMEDLRMRVLPLIRLKFIFRGVKKVALKCAEFFLV
jgi:hypothetical protein